MLNRKTIQNSCFSNSHWKTQYSTHDQTHPNLKPKHCNFFFLQNYFPKTKTNKTCFFESQTETRCRTSGVSKIWTDDIYKNNVFSHSGLLWLFVATCHVFCFPRWLLSWLEDVLRFGQQLHFGIWTDSAPDRRHGRRTLKLTESQEISEDLQLQEAVRATYA